MSEKLSSILFEPEAKEPEQKKARIDLKFELTVLQCAIGCLVNDMDMSEQDYIRMHLAISRLLKAERG